MRKTLAAVDIGSNAIRLIIAEVEGRGKIKILKKIREPVRLGHDVFTKGSLSNETSDRFHRAFDKFNKLFKKHKVEMYRIVATSAMREAKNATAIVQSIQKQFGLKIEVIDGHEEGQIIHFAVCKELDLKNKSVLMIDIGGGSVEFSFSKGDHLLATKSFPLGTVRLLEKLAQKKTLDSNQIQKFIETEMLQAKLFIESNIALYRPTFAIGTGGNLEAMGRLKIQILKKTPNTQILLKELLQISNELSKLTIEERAIKFDFRKDRADVIFPATIIVSLGLKYAQLEQLVIPHVGLRDGLIWNLLKLS